MRKAAQVCLRIVEAQRGQSGALDRGEPEARPERPPVQVSSARRGEHEGTVGRMRRLLNLVCPGSLHPNAAFGTDPTALKTVGEVGRKWRRFSLAGSGPFNVVAVNLLMPEPSHR
jgi:hypothetical protein